MKIYVQIVVLGFLALVSLSCAKKNDKAFKEFEQQYSKAQQAYCSTNIFVAEQGVGNFREWLMDTNNSTEPALNRDSALFLINGRLFLI
jgi:hypothetical protein